MTWKAAGDGRVTGRTGSARCPFAEGEGLEGGSAGRRAQFAARTSAWTANT